MKTTLTKNQMKAVQNYPKNYYNYSFSNQVSETTKKQLIESALNSLNKNSELNEVHCSTGNTIVIASRVHEEDGGGIRIIVSKNYEEIYVDNSVFSK